MCPTSGTIPHHGPATTLADSLLARAAGTVGVAAPVTATVVVLIAGVLTPGYDPVRRTVSRLAERGLPAANVVDLAIALVGCGLLGLALAMRPGAIGARILLAIAGAGLLVAAAVRLDPASEQATTIHRLATTMAMLTLTVAPLAFARLLRGKGYRRVSFGFGASEVAMLLVALAMLPTDFTGWGVWERSFLGLSMAWMVLLSARLLRTSSTDPMFSSTAGDTSWASKVSVDDTMNAAAASASSRGS